MSDKIVRIGGASGAWGDSPMAIPQLLEADVQYLMMDYLAEVTMSLLARARMKDPEAGYPPDVISYLKPSLPEIARRGQAIPSHFRVCFASGQTESPLYRWALHLGGIPILHKTGGKSCPDFNFAAIFRFGQLNDPKCRVFPPRCAAHGPIAAGMGDENNRDSTTPQLQQPRQHQFPGISVVFSKPGKQARKVVEEKNFDSIAFAFFEHRSLRRVIREIQNLAGEVK